MRTFIMAVLMVIEEKYDFISGGVSIEVAGLIVAGLFIAIYQDFRELFR